MKRMIALLFLLLFIPTSCFASVWWNDWKGDDYYEYEYDDAEEAYERGYDDGFFDGTEDPFHYDDDKASAFGYWFLNQEWTANDIYAWKSVFNSLFDDIDRTDIEYKEEFNYPVYVAIVTGTVFHNTEDCSKLSSAYIVETLELEDAIQRGFKPCKTCSKK